MACILLWSSAVRVHDSQAYRKINVTRGRISRISELREILLSFQTGFSLVSAAVVCAIPESILGLESAGVDRSRQHPSRTGSSRWRGCNHRSHNNLQQDLADRRMADPMDPVLSHYASQERQPAAVRKLLNNQPHQSPKQRSD